MDKFRIDGHKLAFHPHRVAQWLDGKDDWERAKSIYPLYVEISPVGACNHRCTFCAVDYLGYKPVTIEGALLRERIAEMASLGVKSVMLAGEGEPLLHKEINATVLSASRHLDVAITTNGVLFDKLEVLDSCTWVKVSVNAGREQTYRKVHKAKAGDWEKVWENLAAAAKRKGACTIGAQMVLLKENCDEVADFEARCKEAGLDYWVVKPYSQHKFSVNKNDWKPVSFPKSIGQMIAREQAAATKDHPYEKCAATPYLWAYIMSTGDVYSCSAYLLDDRFRLGSINSDSFRSVWESDARRRNWSFVREHLDISECRVNCRMARVNEYLSSFGQPHENFI